jgi:myotubularin-related protein 1/2
VETIPCALLQKPQSLSRWRISDANSNYTLCMTYPSQLLVPSSITDAELQTAAAFRGRGRIPVVTWVHPNGAVLARSAQPLVGLMMNSRNEADEALVACLWRNAEVAPQNGNQVGYRGSGSQSISSSQLGGPPPRQGSFSGVLESSPRRAPPKKLYIVDARPRKNAFANGAMGGGSEGANYANCEVVFLGIENIHTMRDSFNRLALYIDSYGQGAGFDTSRPPPLPDTNWLTHSSMLLSGAAWVAGKVQEGCSVLVHCSDGWDRTTELVCLAQLLLDGHYRTFEGFRDLVEKDWLALGHPFSERMGLPDAASTVSRQGSLTLGSTMWERRASDPGTPEARR